MSLDFLRNYSGSRLEQYTPQPLLPETNDEEAQDNIDLDYETGGEEWVPLDLQVPSTWQVNNWSERPLRFIDGKDVGQTIATLSAPRGYLIPVRLAQIGGVAMRIENGQCRRDFEIVERTVAMVTDPFPWNEIESFAHALQTNGFRLLSARPGAGLSYDFEKMRKATDNRTMDEMVTYEQAAITQTHDLPTVIDGRLEPRKGGFDPLLSPVFGVIKTHHQNYLNNQAMQVLYRLEAGQRTPSFTIKERNFSVVTWYLRLSGFARAMPTWGIVRVEISQSWFEAQKKDRQFIDMLSQTICNYRCREKSYSRAPVSLHPIVRAEESLGALFLPTNALANRLYRLTGL